MKDTTPEMEALFRRRLMALPPARRFLMGCAMFDAAREMVLASLPAGLSDEERRRRIYERTYGEPLPEGFGSPLVR